MTDWSWQSSEFRMSGFVELHLRSACSRHPLWKRPRSGKVKLKNGCFLNLYYASSKNSICFYLWNHGKYSYIKPCMNAHSILQNRLSKVKEQSWQLSFRNQTDRIIIQLFAYLRLSPLDTWMSRLSMIRDSKHYKQIHQRRGRRKDACLFLSSNQKRVG